MEKKAMPKSQKTKKSQDIRLIPKVQTAEGWRRQRVQEQAKTKGKTGSRA